MSNEKREASQGLPDLKRRQRQAARRHPVERQVISSGVVELTVHCTRCGTLTTVTDGAGGLRNAPIHCGVCGRVIVTVASVSPAPSVVGPDEVKA